MAPRTRRPRHGETAAQASADTRTEANKAKLLEFYRVVFEAQDVSHAGDVMAVDGVEHNPTAGQGLAGFVQGFGSRWKPRPVAAALRNPPVEMVAEGDLVQLVFKRPRPEPTDPTKTYDSFWFDLFRMKDAWTLVMAG